MLQHSLRRLFRCRRIIIAALGLGAIVLIFVSGVAKAEENIPVIPHDVEGREQCLMCHSTGGAIPVPSSHSSFNDGMCLSCHEVAAGGEDTPSTTGGSSTIGTTTSAGSCQQCHRQTDLSMKLKDGETLSLYIDPQVYGDSIHGDKLLCTDCHTTITEYPHPAWEINTKREYNLAQYELCKQCHFDNYTKTLDSIHYQVLSEGDMLSPICTDCHGSHDVSSPSEPRAKISQTCSQCHGKIYQEYVNSVHGNSLIKGNNYDVPVCTDCHLSHTIEDPRTASFRMESVRLCSNCHGDAELMAKYGISPDVVKTYLNDFHGRTVALVEKQEREIWVEEAVCTDCHGIHDIQQIENPDSPVIKANLLNTCRKCHPDADVNFSGAWLSHYEPSLSKTPMIFFVRWFYRILIPFILAGLMIHILLDLWRKITNR